MNAKPIESKSEGIEVHPGKGQKPQAAKAGLPAKAAPEGDSAKVAEPVLPQRGALLDAFHYWVMSRP